MGRTTIKGNKALAAHLGVHAVTVGTWKRRGILEKAILVEYGRTIVYDVEKVYECLHHRPVKPGRPSKQGRPSR